MVKYNVYVVSKTGTPKKLVSGVTAFQARKIVKNSKAPRDAFIGFEKSTTKVNNRSSFRTTK